MLFGSEDSLKVQYEEILNSAARASTEQGNVAMIMHAVSYFE